MALTFLGDGKDIKQAKREALLSANNSKAAGITRNMTQIDPEVLHRHKARIDTLRPKSS